MIKKVFIFLFGIVCLSVLVSANDPTLVTVNGKEISKSDFEYLYQKNLQNTVSDTKSVNEYLEMFINFKLKVAEAEALKMDTAKSFINELAGYRKQLAASYLLDDSYKESLMKEAFERMKEEVEIGHIFIKLPTAAGVDTVEAYKTAQKVMVRLKKEDFDVVAKELSEDAKSKEQGGYMGYLSALKTIYLFESIAYNTPIGKISGPVKSAYGYHIIKVYSRRPSRGKLLVAQLLKKANDSLPDQNVKAQNDIQLLYSKIMAGEDFAALAKENSDDLYSAPLGGQLPWIEGGTVVKAFEDAAYAIKEIGQVSPPVKTFYGWHIIKLLDKKDLGSYEEEKAEIAKHFSEGDRAEMVFRGFIDKLKKEYNYTFFPKNWNQLIKLAEANSDSVFYENGLQLNKTVFSFADKNYTQRDFVLFMKTNAITVKQLNMAITNFSTRELYLYENTMLEKKYPAFANLMQEYRDGILLFAVSNEMVWEKAMNDSLGLRRFFELNKENYSWDEPRFKGRIVHCKNKKTKKKVKQIFQTAHPDSIDNELSKLNVNDIVVKSEMGLFAKGTKKEIDYYGFNIGAYTPSDDFPIVFLEGKQLIKPESCADCRGQVIQDYQAFLDKEWIKELRKKYTIFVDEAVLSSVSTSN